MKRAVLSAVLVAAALVLQLNVVNRLPLPGVGTPDLVLLAVVALGLSGSPAVGAVTGFCAGLCLDLAPPGSYLIGEFALVFCLVGYLCGRLRGAVNDSALLTAAAAMIAAAAGEALIAVVGKAVSDPQVTWPAVREVLPSSVVYDAVLSPFVLYLVMQAVRWADGLARAGAAAGQPADGAALLARAQAGGALPGSSLAGATALGGAGLLGGAGWLAGPVGARGSRRSRGARGPRAPRLREAASRTGDGWLGGGPRTGLPAPQRTRPAGPGRTPRLRPASGSAGSAVARPPRALPRSPAKLRMGAARRGDGRLARAAGSGPGLAAAAAAGSGLRGRAASGPPGSAFRRRRPGSGGPASLAVSGASQRGPLGRGAPARSPKFRPNTRLPGASSTGRAAVARELPSRRVALRLGKPRRHGGVVGAGALGGATQGLGGLRGGAPRGLAARPVNLRLSSGRRRDGALGGISGGRGFFKPRRLASQRRATPRFRSGPTAGRRRVLGRRAPLRAGKRARFTKGRSSFLATWTGGRLGGRSTVWRIGSKRIGGLR